MSVAGRAGLVDPGVRCCGVCVFRGAFCYGFRGVGLGHRAVGNSAVGHLAVGARGVRPRVADQLAAEFPDPAAA